MTIGLSGHSEHRWRRSGIGFPFGAAYERYADVELYPGQKGLVGQGVSAEIIANEHDLSRDDLDAFGVRSQELAEQIAVESRFIELEAQIETQGSRPADARQRIGELRISRDELAAVLQASPPPGEQQALTDARMLNTELRRIAQGARDRAERERDLVLSVVRVHLDDEVLAALFDLDVLVVALDLDDGEVGCVDELLPRVA